MPGAPDPCPVDPVNDSGWACRDTSRCVLPCPVKGEDPADGAQRPEPMPEISDEERQVWLDLIAAAITFGMGWWAETIAGEREEDDAADPAAAPALEFFESYLPLRQLVRHGTVVTHRIGRTLDELHDEDMFNPAAWRNGVHHAESRIRAVLDGT